MPHAGIAQRIPQQSYDVPHLIFRFCNEIKQSSKHLDAMKINSVFEK